MKVIKTMSLNKRNGSTIGTALNTIKGGSKRSFTKSEISILTVLEKVGLVTLDLPNGGVTPTFGREIGNLKVVFIKELPRSRDQIRTISTCFPKYVDNSATFKGSILTYVFSTEKGVLPISECINYGIGGKLIGFVTID